MNAADQLWTWAVAAYGRPGVEATCLALQDQHGLDAPLLLWTAWNASRGEAAGPEARASAVEMSRALQARVVGPVRSARRALRTPPAGVDDRAAQALRAQIQAVELGAERLQLAALAALPTAAADGDAVSLARAQMRALAPPAAALALLDALVGQVFFDEPPTRR